MSIHLLRHTSTQQENTAGKHRDEIFEHVIFVFRTLVPSAWALLYVQLSCSVDNPFITTAYPISPFSVCKNANGYKRSFDANAANISSLSLLSSRRMPPSIDPFSKCVLVPYVCTGVRVWGS